MGEALDFVSREYRHATRWCILLPIGPGFPQCENSCSPETPSDRELKTPSLHITKWAKLSYPIFPNGNLSFRSPRSPPPLLPLPPIELLPFRSTCTRSGRSCKIQFLIQSTSGTVRMPSFRWLKPEFCSITEAEVGQPTK